MSNPNPMKAKIVALQGEVFIKDQFGNLQALKVGMELNFGDVLHQGPGSRITLEWSDGFMETVSAPGISSLSQNGIVQVSGPSPQEMQVYRLKHKRILVGEEESEVSGDSFGLHEAAAFPAGAVAKDGEVDGRAGGVLLLLLGGGGGVAAAASGGVGGGSGGEGGGGAGGGGGGGAGGGGGGGNDVGEGGTRPPPPPPPAPVEGPPPQGVGGTSDGDDNGGDVQTEPEDCSGPPAFVSREGEDWVGSNSIDIKVGTESNDELDGLQQNDELHGAGGDDYLYGREGQDELYGDAGNDAIFGGEGKDDLYGGEGNDHLEGEEAKDNLFGEAGNDVLCGGEGEDELDGGKGKDHLYGDNGSDTLIGGAGDDHLHGGNGPDKFSYNSFGSDGRDLIYDFNNEDSIDLSQAFDIEEVEGDRSSLINREIEGGDLLITVDGYSDFSITVKGGATLTDNIDIVV